MDNYTSEEKRFRLLIQALKYSTVGLKMYVDQCLEDLYGRLKKKVGSNGACAKYCSKRFNVTQWCSTCAAWKRETEKFMRYKSHSNKVQWRDIKLWKLSGTDCEGAKIELCRIFVRDSRMSTFDIHTILSLLQNCEYFLIGKDIKRLEAFRKVRNIDFAHTDEFKMSRRQLKTAILSILHFLKHPSLEGYQCISTTVIDIQGLITKNKNSLAKIEVNGAFNNLRQIREEDINDFLSLSVNDEDIKKPDKHHAFVLLLVVAILINVSVTSDNLRKDVTNETNDLVCKDATYDHPFIMDVDLDFYRSQHDKLIGREWLLNELDEKMYFSKRGVLLLAEMGYGKSAIVAHLICQSDKRFPGNWIYEHIAVYHLCNFYSRKTLSPGNFVKNLAGGFSKRIPGFLYALQKNSRFNLYFENHRCLEDPEGCLDFLVLKALNDLDMGNKTYIVLIDALDECVEHGYQNIFNLLWKRLSTFPTNIKFFITSRNISDIKIARTHLDVNEKGSLDPDNLEDALKMTKTKLKSLSLTEQDNIKRLFKTNDLNTSLFEAVKYTSGNMLLLKTALTVWLKNDVFLQGSKTKFEDLFEDQLKRIFRDRHNFKNVTKIFQVLCTTMEPLYIEELMKIADLKDEEIGDVLAIIGKELSHFIRQTNNKISLVHQSLAAYLTDNTRKTEQFYVSKRDGCRLFAKYFLNLLKQERSFTNISIIDLAFYAACSSDKVIKYEFLQNGKIFIGEFSDIYILHQAAAKLNSYTAMSLLLDLFSLRPVDETDKGNITASYVAAAFGNHRSLKALLDRHADVNFIRLGPKFINESVDMLQFCKTFAFWEYSLLNIAAQNGHFETVLTLIRADANISHQTSFGSNSFLLAVENGYTHIVQAFLLRFKSVYNTSQNQALYLSAKNGYLDIVDLLLYHGAEDLCLPCSSLQYWTSYHETRLQTIDSGEDLQLYNFVFLDDRRFIRCETALEIAIQNGHTEVVQALLKRSNDTLNCREAGGRTPAFTAIKYKRSEIFKLLLKKDLKKSDRCLYRIKRVDVIDLNEKERKEYLENNCPNNVTLSHYLAYNWDRDVFYFGQSFNIWNWTERDSDGATPVHYACCAGNSDMIDILERDRARFDIRSSNGSTPLHSAAICRRNKVLSYLLYQYPKSVFDNQKRSVSHYVAMGGSFPDVVTEDIMNNYEDFVIYLEHKLYEEALLKDSHYKSPLHYACENGNVNLFKFYYNFISKSQGISNHMITHDNTLLDSAIGNIPILFKNVVSIVKHCNIYLFSSDESCEAERRKIFTTHEYLTYLILNISDKSRNVVLQNLEKYINISLQKNNAHLLGIIFYNFPQDYKQYMYRKGFASLKNLFKHPEINPELFLFLPNMSYDCSNIKSEAILHDIVQDERRTFWTSRYFDFSIFHISSRSLDKCADANGYNFLHRSIIGGNYKAFRFLSAYLGMSFFTKTRNGKTLLQLLVDHAPCFEEKEKIRELVVFTRDKNSIVHETWTESNFGSGSYIAISSFLAKETRLIRHMTLYEICNHASESISFTHKVAAKGFKDLLVEIEKHFGPSALNCENKIGITIKSLLRFFNHYKTNRFFLKLKTGKVSMDILSSLFVKIILDFKPFVLTKNSLELKCNYRMKNFRNSQRMYLCLLKMEEELLRTQVQHIKVTGVKSPADFDASMSETYIYKHKTLTESFAKNYVDTLNTIENRFGNRKNSNNAKCLSYETLLSKAKNKMCLNTKMSLEKINSTECLNLITELTFKKIIYQYFYSDAKYRKMFLILYLYEHEYNIPFEYDEQFFIDGVRVGYADIYFNNMIMRYIQKHEFHMQRKYQFLDWFKSCKNCLAKKMSKQISLSTIKEIQKWKGSSFIKKSAYIPDAADRPLDAYYPHIEEKLNG